MLPILIILLVIVGIAFGVFWYLNKRKHDDEQLKILSQELETSASQVDSDALHEAAKSGNIELLRQLMEAGYGTNRANADGQTALTFAAFYGQSQAVRFLLNRGAHVDAMDHYGATPIIYAARKGDLDSVIALAEMGANLDVQEKHTGGNALMLAAKNGHKEMVQTLLQRGANPGLKDHQQKSALDHARLKGHLEIAAILSKHVSPNPSFGETV